MSQPREEYGNGLYVQGYLTTAINTTATTLNVQGGDWSVFGVIDSNFEVTVRIDGEIMIVTAISGSLIAGWVLTVSRYAGSSHNVGSLIYPVLTGASLKKLYRQSVNGVNYTARRELNFMPEGFSMKIEENPAAEQSRIRMFMPQDRQFPEMRAPSLLNWTQLAQADSAALATVVYDYNGISMRQSAATSATHRVQALYRNSSDDVENSGRKKLILTTSPDATVKYGIMTRDPTTGSMLCLGWQVGQTAVQAWEYSNSNTLVTAFGTVGDLLIPHNQVFLGVGNDYSIDGQHYELFGTNPFSGHSGTYSQHGFWYDCPSGQFASVRLVSMT